MTINPEDEAKRLVNLYALHILDTPPEERFDRITRTLAYMFTVPIALVSLVDMNRQWFKSCIGLPFSETERGISFCTHTILGNELFVIPDTHADSRFANNPLVTDAPYIRFYAGVPLSTADGSKLGTLCMMDQQPRNLDVAERQRLRDLGAWAELELSVVQSLQQQRDQAEELLAASEAHLETIIETALTPMAIVQVDDGVIRFANTAFGQILDLPSTQLIGMTDTPFYTNPQDRQQMIAVLSREDRLSDYPLLLRRVDGTSVQVRLTILPILFAGEAAWLVGGQPS